MSQPPRSRVLVLSTFTGTNANVIGDYLFSFNAHSRHDYRYVFDARTLCGPQPLTPDHVRALAGEAGT